LPIARRRSPVVRSTQLEVGGADVLVVAAVLSSARKQVLGPERATADDAAILEIGECAGTAPAP
jgi:hypothetical protein